MSVPLRASGLTLRYDGGFVVEELDMRVPPGSFTAVVGPNASGKSTLLRGLARLLRPVVGTVYIDGHDIHALPSKQVARRLGLLPQDPQAPDAITVAELVGRGRFPYQRLLRQWTEADAVAVDDAMAATGVADLADRTVDELSGGQRQRVWIAMVLAQQTPLLLLDEPTTFLDIAHAVDVLELCADLRESGRTLVAVLHDINQACRYATHMIVMKDGRIAAEGEPGAIITAELVTGVFGLPCRIVDDPETGTPLVIPRVRARFTAVEEPA